MLRLLETTHPNITAPKFPHLAAVLTFRQSVTSEGMKEETWQKLKQRRGGAT